MSEEIREIYKEGPGFDEEFEEEFEESPETEEEVEDEEFVGPEFSDADEELPETDDEFEARMKKRRARVRGRKRRRKILGVLIVIILFASLATMCGRDIVRLNRENIALRRQQKELEEERDKLREEVKSAGDREYVQEQAKKQLKLLNPGELLFTFEEEEK